MLCPLRCITGRVLLGSSISTVQPAIAAEIERKSKDLIGERFVMYNSVHLE